MRHAPKRKASRPAWRTVAMMVAPVWLLPAVMINVDWGAGILDAWNIAATASIAGAAFLLSASSDAATRFDAASFRIAATLLIVANFSVAFGNLSHRTGDGRDHRATQSATIERLREQRSQLSDARKSASLVAAGKPTLAIVSEIDAAVATNARRWAATHECSAASVTATASMQFCGLVAQLRGQLAGARERDTIDAQIRRMDSEAAKVGALVSVADPFTDGVMSLAAAVGVSLPKAFAQQLPSIRDGLRALALELLAALGPMAWVQYWSKRPSAPARVAPVRAIRRTAVEVSPNQFTTFVEARIERRSDQSVRAGDAWSEWRAWCADRGVDCGSQKQFGQQMSRRFVRDRNNGRPRYLGAVMRQRPGPMAETQSVGVLPFVARPRLDLARVGAVN